jgi:hypothetical protein
MIKSSVYLPEQLPKWHIRDMIRYLTTYAGVFHCRGTATTRPEKEAAYPRDDENPAPENDDGKNKAKKTTSDGLL